MKKIFLRLLIAIIVSISMTSYFYSDNEVYAKSKKETQHEIFNKLKMNSSVDSVAKVIYGSKYKSKVCDRKDDDVKVNLLCNADMFESNVYYKNNKLRYLNYEFYFYPDKPYPSDSRSRMQLTFKSKDGSKRLYLVEKFWYDSSVYNSQKVYNSKKIKVGMTKKQLDSIMTGKGIGAYEGITYTNYSKAGYQEGKKKPVYYSPYKVYSYTTQNQNLNVLYSYDMEYDHKKKDYIVSYVSRFSFN